MIRFLLADDEPHIRNWIEHKADFETAGISEFRGFDDGDTALAAFQEQTFDILMTDIRMPRMDGLTLAEKAREINPDVVVLFLSAYSDKEYYRSAIRLHAATFIEKPIDLQELNQAICDAAQEVRRRRREIENEKLTALVRNETIPWALVQGEQTSCPPELAETSSLTVVLSTRGEKSRNYSYEFISSTLSRCGLWGIFSRSDPEIDLYILNSQPNNFSLALSQFCREMYAHTGDRFAVGASVSEIAQLPNSLSLARENCNALFFTGAPLIWPEEILNTAWKFPKDLLLSFSEALESGKKSECVQLVNGLTESLSRCQRTPVREVKEFYFRILVCIFEAQQRLDGKKQKMGDDNHRYHWETVFLISSLFVLKNYVMENLSDYFETLNGMDGTQARYQAILDAIEKNFRNPALTLSDLGAMTYMSVPYLCTIFKSKSGITVNSYLTTRRMQEAKRLLALSDSTISQIAQQIGFSDQNYFSKRFSKIYGISPSKYRETLTMPHEDDL